MKFKELREKFNQRVPSGKKLVDMEVFLDDKDIKQALMILTSQLKRDKLTHNKKMINVKRGDMGKADVMINAIDEGDRWRLIVLKNAPDMKNPKEVDLTSPFMAIQKLPSAEFKNMYAEEVKEESEDEQHKLVKGIEVILKTNKGKLKMKFNVDVSGYVHYSRPPQKSALIYDPKKFGWKKPIKNNRDLLNFTKVLLKKVPNLMKDNVN